jgi:hypothetical protein
MLPLIAMHVTVVLCCHHLNCTGLLLSEVFQPLQTLSSIRSSLNSEAILRGAISLWKLWLKIEEARSRLSAKREEVKAGSEKLEVDHGEAFPQEGFCWLRTVPLFPLT